MWLGLVLPLGVANLVGWGVLVLSLVLHCRTGDSSNGCSNTRNDTHSNTHNTQCCDTWHRDTLAIGCVLLLFDLSWGTGLTSRTLTTLPGVTASSSLARISLHIISVVASATLGMLTLLHFCVLSPVVRSEVKRVFCVCCSRHPQIKPVDELAPSLDSPCKMDDPAVSLDSPYKMDESALSLDSPSKMDFKVITVPLPQGLEGVDESEFVNRMIDL